MDPTEHEQDPGRRPSRRRRVIGLLLVVAAIAIPSLAFAGGGGGSTGSLSPAPADDDVPSIFLQDEGDRDGKRGDHDGRDCPFKHRNRGVDSTDQRDL
jgi:hypothetical protein